MNQGIDFVQIAQRLLHPVGFRFKDELSVLCRIELFPCHSLANFKGHIESGSSKWRGSIKTNSGKVMNRVATALNLRKNFAQSSCSAG